MNLGIENKKVLITGGSRGIGRAAAEALAKEGCHVAVVARTKKKIDEFASTNVHHKAFVYDLFEEGMPEKNVS